MSLEEIMKKKGLELGLEGWAGRKVLCLSTKGVGNFYSCDPPWKTTALGGNKDLIGTLRITFARVSF